MGNVINECKDAFVEKNIDTDQMEVVDVSDIQDGISAHSGREADTEVLQKWANLG